MNTDFSTITSMFQANSSLFEKATHGIPDGQWLTQPCTDSNHLLFIAGHVVVHRAFVPKYLGVECSAPWARLFCARCEEGERVAQGNIPALLRSSERGRKRQRNSLLHYQTPRQRYCHSRFRKKGLPLMERWEERSVYFVFTSPIT